MSINPHRPSCCLESAPEPDCTMCIEICIFVHVGWKVDQRRIEWCTMYMSQIGLVEPWSEPHGGIIVFWEWYWCKEGECWFSFIKSLKLGNCNDTSLEPRDDDSWFYNCTTKFEGMGSLKSTMVYHIGIVKKYP